MLVNFKSGHTNKGPFEECVYTVVTKDFMGPSIDSVSSSSERLAVVDQLSEELEGSYSFQDTSRLDNGDGCIESGMGCSSRSEKSSKTMEQCGVKVSYQQQENDDSILQDNLFQTAITRQNSSYPNRQCSDIGIPIEYEWEKQGASQYSQGDLQQMLEIQHLNQSTTYPRIEKQGSRPVVKDAGLLQLAVEPSDISKDQQNLGTPYS